MPSILISNNVYMYKTAASTLRYLAKAKLKKWQLFINKQINALDISVPPCLLHMAICKINTQWYCCFHWQWLFIHNMLLPLRYFSAFLYDLNPTPLHTTHSESTKRKTEQHSEYKGNARNSYS